MVLNILCSTDMVSHCNFQFHNGVLRKGIWKNKLKKSLNTSKIKQYLSFFIYMHVVSLVNIYLSLAKDKIVKDHVQTLIYNRLLMLLINTTIIYELFTL